MRESRSDWEFVLPMILAAVFFCGNLNADDALPLPGHSLNLDETVKHSYGLLVATFENVEYADPGPPGAADFGTRWKVKQVLRGKFASETDLSIRVQSLPKGHAESMPTLNRTYILIGYGPDIDHQQMAIILEDTPENLKRVSSLLKQ